MTEVIVAERSYALSTQAMQLGGLSWRCERQACVMLLCASNLNDGAPAHFEFRLKTPSGLYAPQGQVLSNRANCHGGNAAVLHSRPRQKYQFTLRRDLVRRGGPMPGRRSRDLRGEATASQVAFARTGSGFQPNGTLFVHTTPTLKLARATPRSRTHMRIGKSAEARCLRQEVECGFQPIGIETFGCHA